MKTNSLVVGASRGRSQSGVRRRRIGDGRREVMKTKRKQIGLWTGLRSTCGSPREDESKPPPFSTTRSSSGEDGDGSGCEEEKDKNGMLWRRSTYQMIWGSKLNSQPHLFLVSGGQPQQWNSMDIKGPYLFAFFIILLQGLSMTVEMKRGSLEEDLPQETSGDMGFHLRASQISWWLVSASWSSGGLTLIFGWNYVRPLGGRDVRPL